MENKRHVGRPQAPKDYGIPPNLDGTLPWAFVDENMSTAKNYWVSTIHPDGRPHTRPTWGVWLDDHLFLDGSPETRRFRNIASNPNISVNLESGSRVVIMEGTAKAYGRPTRMMAERLARAYSTKYSSFDYQPGPETWDEGGLYIFTPARVFAWTKFPDDMTKWVIDP